MSMQGIAGFIRRWWLLLVIVPVITGALAYALGTTRTPMYASSTTLQVSIAASSDLNGYNANLLAQDLSTTYQTLVITDPVLQPVAAAANPPMATGELRANTTIAASSGALFTVTMTDPDPARAATLVNAVTAEFTAFVSGFVRPEAGVSEGPGTVTTFVEGTAPDEPYAPRLPAWVALGVIAGILVSSLGIMLFERLDTRVRTTSNVAEVAGASRLAQIPSLGKGISGPESVFLNRPGASQAGEAIRSLRTAVLGTYDEPGKVLVISSANRRDGKTIVAANLATALANSGKLVVLIDGNLRDPRLHSIFQINNVHGLGTLLSVPNLSWKTSAIRVAPNLAVIPAGSVREHPADLLVKPEFKDLLADVSATADVVIIDTPAMEVGNDALAVAMHAKSVVLLCRTGTTHSPALSAASASFHDVGADVLGVVVNEGGSRRGFGRLRGRSARKQAAGMDSLRADSSHVAKSA
ncbi:MAG: polysaccharide biosynthesis tyrosine autokinase [Chloroflexia bacterium]|nr:polysaccharide biosynthesis tyrosine autokinase [Chloroflexia bacterium]